MDSETLIHSNKLGSSNGTAGGRGSHNKREKKYKKINHKHPNTDNYYVQFLGLHSSSSFALERFASGPSLRCGQVNLR